MVFRNPYHIQKLKLPVQVPSSIPLGTYTDYGRSASQAPVCPVPRLSPLVHPSLATGMKLTPIQVKGKGGHKKGCQKKTWRPPDPQRVAKRERDENMTGDDGEDGLRRRRRREMKKPAARVELLPTEILERIIFMSENLNFLRSSLRIGYRCSSRSFLTELLEAAFSPTWEVWFGCPRNLISSYANYVWDVDRVGGSPDFQVCNPSCNRTSEG